jgi:hypothetical protein
MKLAETPDPIGAELVIPKERMPGRPNYTPAPSPTRPTFVWPPSKTPHRSRGVYETVPSLPSPSSQASLTILDA